VVIGTGMTGMAPGSLEGLQLVVPDMAATRTELLRRGAEISAVQDMGGIAFAYFSDPDGNQWLLQEVTTRLPGRVAGETTYASVSDLSQTLRRAEAAHGEHERRTGQRDANWPDWYAEYMVAEQAGKELPL